MRLLLAIFVASMAYSGAPIAQEVIEIVKSIKRTNCSFSEGVTECDSVSFWFDDVTVMQEFQRRLESVGIDHYVDEKGHLHYLDEDSPQVDKIGDSIFEAWRAEKASSAKQPCAGEKEVVD